MTQLTINLDDYLREIATELQKAEQVLHDAELRAAELRGQRDLLLRMMQLPIRTDGVEPPSKGA